MTRGVFFLVNRTGTNLPIESVVISFAGVFPAINVLSLISAEGRDVYTNLTVFYYQRGLLDCHIKH